MSISLRAATFCAVAGFALQASASQPSMLQTTKNYTATPIFTVGETIGSYTPVGILDGLGAYKLSDNLVRVYANHELLHFRGNTYTVDGISMTGARVSYFDIAINSRKVVRSGLAYNSIWDASGRRVRASGFLANGFNGFSRFCSSQLVPANQFGSTGVGENIYFTGEEDGGFFNGVGGAVWALDPATRRFFQVPAMGRGAWENITQIDTGSPDTVAFILADDTSPFDFDGDGEREAAPLFLYVGTKDADGKLPNGQSDFLARNGLRTGKLYVWVADSGVKVPSEFNGKGSTQAGKWVEIDNAPTGTPSEDGSTGFDNAGYPTQGTLWLRAKAVGSFGFSRPEDVATNPADGTEIVLASTGVDTYDIDSETGNGADTFGTLYKIKTQFPTGDFQDLTGLPLATVSILYDGDEDKSRLLRSPDNLVWSADGFIYVQEDEAEEDTASGDEVLFGPGAANPREAGIARLRANGKGSISRVANIKRNVILDPTTAGTPVDKDSGAAGEWESSGIIDVSTLFGKAAGTLFLTTVQAHGIEDQTDFNADSRINDNDLVEGGQLLFIEKN